MAERDFRTVNMGDGQQIEYDQVMKRIGDISYRDFGVFCKSLLFDTQKALVTKGLRVEPSSLLTVNIPAGTGAQRIGDQDVLPFIAVADQTITIDAATGSPRTDLIEAQVQVIVSKPDTTFGIVDPESILITQINVYRDVQYILSVRKQTGTTTPTAATAGILTGTIAIPGTIDLASNYLINVADGEDGAFQEVDCRGATPEATTRAEIIAALNAAIGRTATATGSGNVIEYTGEGTGITSTFFFKPPSTDANLDALDLIFGLSTAGAYFYTYVGTNEWFKIAEINMGAATTVITATEILDLDEKSSWAAGSSDIIVRKLSLDDNDVYSDDGQVKVLDAGTDGTDATFTGDVTGDLTGDVTGDLVGTADEADSVVETNASVVMNMKVIDIGDWNMDLTSSLNVLHGSTLSKIRNVNVMVRDDNDTNYHLLTGQFNYTTAIPEGGIERITTTTIWLEREVGGLFDSTLYDATSYNRGWITIWYTD